MTPAPDRPDDGSTRLPGTVADRHDAGTASPADHITPRRNVQPPPHRRRLGPRRMIGMAVAAAVVVMLLLIFF